MKRVIAVFGGSFNPPHAAHQLAALWVLETQPVDELLVVPSFRHPFEKALAPFEHRVAMCELMLAPLAARAQVSTIESTLSDGRTLHVLEALKARQPDARLRLVIGADILREVDKWYCWPDIERLALPIVVGRSGYPPGEDETVELPAISSTEVRARAAAGEPLTPLVPKSVARYIADHGLYR